MADESIIPWYDKTLCGCSNRRMCRKHYYEAQQKLGSPYTCVTMPQQISTSDGKNHG